MAPKIEKLLVANRGEIAIRILRTAAERNIQTVAVYSEADEQALHRKSAQESVCIGPGPSRESYLKIDAIIKAAKEAGANAIHPGYGFLSENAEFATAVEKAGLIFVGPSADIIRSMGDKVEARQLADKAGVPTVPGTGAITTVDEGIKTVSELSKKRKDFKYPLLVKAAGGGGGKGMRVVRKPEDLRENLERAQSEALKAFSNSTVFVERFLERPRHIEVQIVGDGAHSIHLFERECSLQRRHQKVIEEALSPSLTDSLQQDIRKAAVRIGESVKYRSVGTVEFIVSEDDEFYFLEMNTRIQVEHPVTEWITGLDIVRMQFDIAEGNGLQTDWSNLQPRGHSIEARLYAEDCENGFLPQPGHLHYLKFPYWTGVRVDSSAESPCQISSLYDPMIAKISAWGPTRDECRKRLSLFLKNSRVEGLISNRIFLIDCLESDFFKKGRYHTQILDNSSWRSATKPTARTVAALCLKDHLERGLQFQNTQLSEWQENYALASTMEFR